MRKTRISDFYCTQCNNKFPLPRTGRQREKGHLKDLFCPKCHEVTKHLEVRERDFILSSVISA